MRRAKDLKYFLNKYFSLHHFHFSFCHRYDIHGFCRGFCVFQALLSKFGRFILISDYIVRNSIPVVFKIQRLQISSFQLTHKRLKMTTFFAVFVRFTSECGGFFCLNALEGEIYHTRQRKKLHNKFHFVVLRTFTLSNLTYNPHSF